MKYEKRLAEMHFAFSSDFFVYSRLRRQIHKFPDLSGGTLKYVLYFLLQEVLHTISAPSGQVRRIVIFKKNGVQAMVEYPLQYTLSTPAVGWIAFYVWAANSGRFSDSTIDGRKAQGDLHRVAHLPRRDSRRKFVGHAPPLQCDEDL